MKNVLVGLLVILVLSLGGYILVDTGVIKIGKEPVIENPEDFDPRKYLSPARDAIKDMVKHKMRNVLGCSGKAGEEQHH